MQRPAILGGLLLVGALALSPNERQGNATQGLVEGTVFDSLEMRPLAGAVVELARPGELPASDTTQPDGRFTFSGIPAGRYLVSFSHPTLDSLGLEAGTQVVTLAEQDSARIQLAIPSAGSIARLLCPSNAKTTTSMLLGFVRSAADGAPIGGSTVWVRFDDYLVSRSRIQRDSMGRVLQTQGNGYYVACGLPADVTVLARAAAGSDTSGYIELELPPSVFIKRDLYIGSMFRVAAPIDSVAAATGRTVQVLRGGGVLSGSVRYSDGRPVSDARVSLWGTGREVRSDDSGAFLLDSLPTGSHMVEARALGFLPQREAIDIREGERTRVALGLTEKQTFLDTVRVLATRAYVSLSGPLAEFERRRRSRIGGYFLDQDEIDRRRAAAFTDLVRGIPTVVIDPDATRGDQIRMIGASNENDPYCDPAIWIDGSKQPQRETSLNARLFPERIVALEVYSRTVEAPVQYQSGSRCGVILVWTGERVRRQIAPEKR